MADKRGKELLNEAFDQLERETPIVSPTPSAGCATKARRIRLPLGILCVIASFFWFLPVIGIEFLPIGRS